MRRLTRSSSASLRWKSIIDQNQRLLVHQNEKHSSGRLLPKRNLARVRSEPLSELWFTSSLPQFRESEGLTNPFNSPNIDDGHKPPDERTIRLGKSKLCCVQKYNDMLTIYKALRTLSPLLPTILSSPLPQEILSPSISLHLFPSTHPHLPAVKGRVPYRAALWTAPVAWGCVPLVGNIKLQILSEKIVRTGFVATSIKEDIPGIGEEKLVVRWQTENKSKNDDQTLANSSAISENHSNIAVNRGLSTLLGGDRPIFNLSKDDEFKGIFVFSFDSKGRIATHTIEHADENNGVDKTSKVVTLTDWLLGKAKWGRGREDELVPGLAMRVCRDEWARGPQRDNSEHDRCWS